MLGEKLDRHGSAVWLVNTGWTGGAVRRGPPDADPGHPPPAPRRALGRARRGRVPHRRRLRLRGARRGAGRRVVAPRTRARPGPTRPRTTRRRRSWPGCSWRTSRSSLPTPERPSPLPARAWVDGAPRLRHRVGCSSWSRRTTSSWSAPAAPACARRSKPTTGRQGRRHLEAAPDPQPLRRGGGRHQRRARQRGRGQPREARLRHRQGLRLPRRPGRDRDLHGRGAGRHLPARALGRRLLAQRGRPARPAPVRRRRLAAHRLRGRHHRPRAHPRAVRAAAEADGRGPRRLRGVLRLPARDRRRALHRRRRLGHDERRRQADRRASR